MNAWITDTNKDKYIQESLSHRKFLFLFFIFFLFLIFFIYF